MSEHEPDPAALDELSRAFGAGPDDPGRGGGPDDGFEGVRILPPGQAPTPRSDRPRPSITDDELEPTAETPAVPPPRGQDPAPPAGAQIISIGGDDELPDAVYVEGSLDAGGRRGPVVVIEDDESGEVLKTETARDLRRGVEPRMRERRDAVRRERLRKRLVWGGVAVTAVLVVVAVLAVLGSSLFAVKADQVTVTGNVYTDPDRLQAIIDDLVGTPTLLADSQDVERELEQIPWVDDAKVTVRFPHSASIEIRERRAVTTYQGNDGRFRVLDREGRVLDVLDAYPIAYVLITGPDPVDLPAGQFAPFGYAAASELALSLTPSVRGRVARIDVTADGAALSLFLDNGTEVRFGEARNLLDKLVRLETLLVGFERERADAVAAGLPEPAPPDVIDVATRETTR